MNHVAWITALAGLAAAPATPKAPPGPPAPATKPAAAPTKTVPPAPATTEGVECLVDTISVHDAEDFASDLQKSLNPSFFTAPTANDQGQVHVPGAMQAPLFPKYDGPLTFFYSFHGWDVTTTGGTQLPEGISGEGLFAVIGAEASELHLALGRKRLAVARALFDALTRAKEVRTDHVARPDTFDRSFTRVRRSTPKGRLICDKLIHPKTDPEPTYTCVVNSVVWTHVQVWQTVADAKSCPSPSGN